MTTLDSVSQAPPAAGRRVRWAGMLGWILLVCAAIPILLSFVSRWWVLAEISTHFRVYYALCAVVAALAFAACRRWRWAGASLAVVVWQAWAIVPWYFPPGQTATALGRPMKIFCANVHADTVNYEAILEQIRREQPDFVYIQEISKGWAKALEALRETHPYSAVVLEARTPYFGLAVYSRFSLEKVERDDPVRENVPMIRADAVVGERRVHLVNVHLSPPEGGWLDEVRYKQFPWLTEYVASRTGPLLVAGDFNCTVWSPLYRDLARRGRLENSRRGHGILSTWFPLAGSLHLLPIDQIVAGGGIQFTGMRLGRRTGSDHCPLIAEFRLPD